LEPLPTGLDLFELVWRLVVDFKAEPALLIHMDAGQLRGAVLHWRGDAGATAPDPYEAALAQLRKKQAELSPNTLWLAWMKATRTHLVAETGARIPQQAANALPDVAHDAHASQVPDARQKEMRAAVVTGSEFTEDAGSTARRRPSKRKSARKR
jgi:hypothetical protein